MVELDPIFPPKEPIYTAGVEAAATASLDEATRDFLARDRATLSHSTAMGILVLQQELHLSEASGTEILQSVLTRTASLPPSYHEYVNKLIASVATVFNGQSVMDMAPRQLDDSVTSEQPASTPPQPDGRPSLVPQTSQASPHVEPLLSPVPDSDHQRGQVDPETEIIKISDSPKLQSYQESVTPIQMEEFLHQTLGGDPVELHSLTSDERSLLAYQVFQLYRQRLAEKGDSSSDDNQVNRLSAYIGLYAPALTGGQLATQIGVSSAAVYSGLKNLKAKLEGIADGNKLLERARFTLQQVDRADLFGGLQPSSDKAPGSNNTPGNPPEAKQEKPFYDHSVTPPQMRTFLQRALPHNYLDAINSMPPPMASALTREIIVAVSRLEGVRLETFVPRSHWVERYTGLYSPDKTVREISDGAIVSYPTVKRGIDQIADDFRSRIPVDRIQNIYDSVLASRPMSQRVSRRS